MSENFYILLELDPNVDDWDAIESKINEMRRRWSNQKSMGAPKARRSAERNLKLVGEMETKLRDAATRKTIATEAKKELRTTKSKHYEYLDSLIKMHKDSKIDAEGVKALVRHAGGSITEDDVIARLKKRGITVQVKTTSKPRSHSRPKIDGATAAGIRDALMHIGKTSLYDFLGMTSRSSPKTLADTADQIYKDLQREGKTDATTTARQELAGHAKAVFRDATSKQKYDNTFAEEAMEGLRGHIDFAGADKYLSVDEINTIVGIARTKGVDPEIATDFIIEIAENRKWGVQSKENNTTVELLLCGFCNTLARDEKDTRCHNCGKALVQPCPQCANPTPTQDECCGNCGCSTGDAPVVEALLRSGNEALARGEIKAAVASFDHALVIWPSWSKAEEAKSKAITKQQARESALNAVSDLIKRHRLQEAEGAVDVFERAHGASGLTRLRQQIDAGLRRAKRLHAEAESLRQSGKTEEAVGKDAEALEACSDYRPAQRALASAPPPAPKDLDAVLVGSTARLKWMPVRASGTVTYRVQRKLGGMPTNPNDGTNVAEVETNTCDDTDTPHGQPFYYAVYSMRGGINSRGAAVHGPKIRLVPVTGVVAEPGDGQVTLRWKKPAHCRNVIVWRRTGRGGTFTEKGVRVSASEESAIDLRLKNGQVYSYQVVAQFEDPAGGRTPLEAPAVSVEAVPITAPAPVTDLKAQRHARIVNLRWTKPPTGTVQLRVSRYAPDLPVGAVLNVADLDKVGLPIPVSGASSAQATLDQQGRVFFCPLTVVAQSAVLGDSVAVTALDDISNLASRRQGKSIYLDWQWPTGATEVFISWRHDRFPRNEEEHADGSRRLTKVEYDRHGQFQINQAVDKQYFFRIFVKDASHDYYSTGMKVLETGGLETQIKYQVGVARSFFGRSVKKAWIDLSTDLDVSEIPAVLAVLRQDLPPLTFDDGQIIAQKSEINFCEGHARIELPANVSHGFVKLFFQNSRDTQRFRLMPAAKEKLRII